MSWFLRAVEQRDGKWLCRFGNQELGMEADEASALAFLAETATALGGRQLFQFYLHHHDGPIETRAGTDPLPGE